MKKVIFYTLAVIGLYSVLFFSYQLVVPRAGMTMYGGAQTAYRAPDTAGSIPADEAAMKAGNISLVPSEPAMKRMIIRNARITLQVNDLSRAIDDITKITEKSNGYVVYSDFNDPLYGGRYAEMSIRIPANGLNSMMNALKGLAVKVVQESVTGEDITEQYVNLESELNNLQTTKTQLTKIMQGATKTPDVLQVFQQLRRLKRK